MRVRVHQPPRSTMQSALGATRDWVIEYELETPRAPEPLMGWTASGDTLNQVRLRFPTKEAALAFAEAEGWQVDLEEPKARALKPRSYLDNFKPGPMTPPVAAGTSASALPPPQDAAPEKG